MFLIKTYGKHNKLLPNRNTILLEMLKTPKNKKTGMKE